jgi:hypothetical protein
MDAAIQGGGKVNKQKYNVSYDGKFDMVVEIDHAVMTDENLHEINRFWGGDKDRLSRANGDVVQAVLKMLASTAFNLTIETWDAIEAFNWANGKGQEGWPTMDGSEGIKIVSIDEVCFDHDDIEVRTV